MIDSSDQVTITITKVMHEGEPSHWGLDVSHNGEELGMGTAPTFAGVYDMAYSIIVGGDKHNWDINPWTTFDANNRQKDTNETTKDI
jgi:hypothetical protein